MLVGSVWGGTFIGKERIGGGTDIFKPKVRWKGKVGTKASL